jgi:2-C-methyl-D-erythritol 4-phosphate cytidylyltransferase
VLAAAGRGRRAGLDIPKQFHELAGRPLLLWSLDALAAAGCRPIVVAVPPGAAADASEILGRREDVITVEGARTRQGSVLRALEHLATERVVVHDAVRPFISAVDVARVVDALRDADAAILAVPVDETLKRVDRGRVTATVARSELWRAQTPQAFKTEVLRAAHERARAEGIDATDDAALVEHHGGRIVVVEGRRDNLKLAYPEDFEIAECILRGRG